MSEQRYNETLVSGRKDGKLANSDNIFDKDRGKMQSEILFESQKKYFLTALFMQKMLEERNSSVKGNRQLIPPLNPWKSCFILFQEWRNNYGNKIYRG